MRWRWGAKHDFGAICCGGDTFVRMPEGDRGLTSRMRAEASADMSALSSSYTVPGHSSSGVRPSFKAASTPPRHDVSWHDLLRGEGREAAERLRKLASKSHLCPSNSSLGSDLASSAEAGGT